MDKHTVKLTIIPSGVGILPFDHNRTYFVDGRGRTISTEGFFKLYSGREDVLFMGRSMKRRARMLRFVSERAHPCLYCGNGWACVCTDEARAYH